MVTDGGASTKTPVLLSGVKAWRGACSVSESLITLCHLNPLSAELLPGSGSLGGSRDEHVKL